MQKRYIIYALLLSFLLIFIIFFLLNLNKNKKLKNSNYDTKDYSNSTILIENSINNSLGNNSNKITKTDEKISVENSINNNLENNSNEIDSNEIAETGEKILMIILEDTLTPAGATVVLKNPNTISFGYDNWFRIDKKENGIWKEETIKNDSTTNSLSYTNSSNKESKVKIDWTNLYGFLNQGEYRLVKKIFIKNQYDENLEEIILYSEFSI